ncbi:cob(I)yrinic acid a,c-diamide adenosyltransferase [Jiulongibacter sediminis]|uniref:Corrinoid adenosyltransferase n=1 Tax=Jiulongibacter sediminis TaxID=1605367 RepID=A0A0P7BD67_9BACT|nr:cob(I)yrinic acid a,c-diamide adenosyltransferase [Jiulongibacter sediminis]KPM48622.1 cob(I)yrinic acid a c-diamide adenosyltransferase [Jiulongibacter sediminis]TBX25160.1 cob(I)yrinic acid a c-diamide adenosyltransferase [Jiulongibacter sediminis]
MAKIYTKTGDKGKTGLIGGKRVSKGEMRIEAYGTVDELNAWIGLLRDTTEQEERKVFLKDVQDKLFTIGAEMANETKLADEPILNLTEEDVDVVENKIDEMNLHLKDLRHFILPGGHVLVSYTHLARTVCRRAERCAIRLHDEEGLNFLIIKYLNRLSDYFFVLGRQVAKELGVEEVKWGS